MWKTVISWGEVGNPVALGEWQNDRFAGVVRIRSHLPLPLLLDLPQGHASPCFDPHLARSCPSLRLHLLVR